MPDVEMAAQRMQQVVELLGPQQIVARGIRTRDRPRPRAVGADLFHQPQRRFLGVVRHLHRQHTARRQRREQARQHLGMIRQPLEHGVAEQKVGMLLRRPGLEVGFDEGAARQALAGLTQHVRRGVEANYVSAGEPLDQNFGRVSGPTAEINDAPGFVERHLCQEIARRTRPLVFEFEILAGRPVLGHMATF